MVAKPKVGPRQMLDIADIWTEYRSGLKAFLHAKVSDPAEVDDLLQEILLKTHSNLEQVQSESSLKAWLFQVANRTIIDFYRDRAKGQKIRVQDLWYEEEGEELETDLSNCVLPFIKGLPDESAALLLAIDIDGLSQKDYAKDLGISYSTLKSRVQKARTELKGLLDECCHFSLDYSGKIVDYQEKTNSCKSC